LLLRFELRFLFALVLVIFGSRQAFDLAPKDEKAQLWRQDEIGPLHAVWPVSSAGPLKIKTVAL